MKSSLVCAGLAVLTFGCEADTGAARLRDLSTDAPGRVEYTELKGSNEMRAAPRRSTELENVDTAAPADIKPTTLSQQKTPAPRPPTRPLVVD